MSSDNTNDAQAIATGPVSFTITMDAKTLAKHLNCSVKTIDRSVATGDLPKPFLFGSKRLWVTDEVMEWSRRKSAEVNPGKLDLPQDDGERESVDATEALEENSSQLRSTPKSCGEGTAQAAKPSRRQKAVTSKPKERPWKPATYLAPAGSARDRRTAAIGA